MAETSKAVAKTHAHATATPPAGTGEKSLIDNRRLRTVADLMGDIEGEIAEIKAGTLTEGRARIVGTFRRMQLRTVEIYLQAARLEAKLRPGLQERMGELPEGGEGKGQPKPLTARALRTESRKRGAGEAI